MALYKGFRWDKWLEGLINAVLGSLSTAVVTYGATVALGEVPDFRVLSVTAGVVALWAFFGYIKDHLPKSVPDEDA